MEQVCLAESDATMYEEGVVCLARGFSDGHCGSMGKAVRRANDEVIEGEAGIQGVGKRGAKCRSPSRGGLFENMNGFPTRVARKGNNVTIQRGSICRCRSSLGHVGDEDLEVHGFSARADGLQEGVKVAVDNLVFYERVGNGDDQAVVSQRHRVDLSKEGLEGLPSTERKVLTRKFPQRNGLVGRGIRHSRVCVVHNVFHSCESSICN
jgi:hypothetical protein